MKEFPPLTAPGAPLVPLRPLTPPGTPEEVWASLREPEPVTPPRANRDLPLPGAPTRKPKPVAAAVRNLNQEFAQPDLDYNEDNMNLVDADYVYHMEQDNTQLRNENDMLKDENCELEREIDKLRDMLVEMITIRGGSTQQMQRMFQQMYQRGDMRMYA